MREILFRGKRLDNGEWVFGAYCAYDSKFDYDKDQFEPNVVYAPSIIAYDDGCLWYRVDPATVGQYTGLTANGKRIFEGDIVKGLSWLSRLVYGVVSFKDGAFGVEWIRGKVNEFSAFTSCCNIEWEIIGNIHDNHELLEGGVNDG